MTHIDADALREILLLVPAACRDLCAEDRADVWSFAHGRRELSTCRAALRRATLLVLRDGDLAAAAAARRSREADALLALLQGRPVRAEALRRAALGVLPAARARPPGLWPAAPSDAPASAEKARGGPRRRLPSVARPPIVCARLCLRLASASPQLRLFLASSSLAPPPRPGPGLVSTSPRSRLGFTSASPFLGPGLASASPPRLPRLRLASVSHGLDLGFASASPPPRLRPSSASLVPFLSLASASPRCSLALASASALPRRRPRLCLGLFTSSPPRLSTAQAAATCPAPRSAARARARGAPRRRGLRGDGAERGRGHLGALPHSEGWLGARSSREHTGKGHSDSSRCPRHRCQVPLESINSRQGADHTRASLAALLALGLAAQFACRQHLGPFDPAACSNAARGRLRRGVYVAGGGLRCETCYEAVCSKVGLAHCVTQGRGLPRQGGGMCMQLGRFIVHALRPCDVRKPRFSSTTRQAIKLVACGTAPPSETPWKAWLRRTIAPRTWPAGGSCRS